jgi:hypothetical protein
MVMRQYERVKSEKGDKFVYSDLKNVYTIIFMEESSNEFKECPDDYIHRGSVTFDTGLQMKMLQEYYYLPIDIFRSIMDNISDKGALSELEAWIYFIGSDRPEDMEKVIRTYPKFAKMYEEINRFRKDPKEAVGMFSEALRIMDENTVKLMIEQQKEEIKAQAEIIQQKDAELARVTEENARQKEELEKYRKMLKL